MSTLRNRIAIRSAAIPTAAILAVASLLMIGCRETPGTAGAGAATEERLRQRVSDYWQLRLDGDPVRRYAFMSEKVQAETPIEEFVGGTGLAIYKRFEIEKVAMEPAAGDESTEARVLVEYDWHISTKVAPLKPPVKTALVEEIWTFENGDWYWNDRVDDHEEMTLSID